MTQTLTQQLATLLARRPRNYRTQAAKIQRAIEAAEAQS